MDNNKKVDEIITMVSQKSVFPMSVNECMDFSLIVSKIEERTGMEAHGVKQVRALELFEHLIWCAATEYHKE